MVMNIFISILLILSTTAGQIFLKLGADKTEDKGFYNGFVLVGYTMFFLTIALSYFFMTIVPMKYFTVIMSLNYISVMISSKLFLNEVIGLKNFFGTLLVALGIFVFFQ